MCTPLRPPSPLPPQDNSNKTYCPIPAGPFALSSSIPWGSHRALTTLNTRIRAVDPSGQELLCLDIPTTPLDPKPNRPYGAATIIFWSTVGLTIAYWVVVGIARIASAWGRGLTRSERGLWSRAQSAGFILASAISGERLATSPALMRFCAFFPGFLMRYLITHRYTLNAGHHISYAMVCCVRNGCSRMAKLRLFVLPCFFYPCS